MTKAELLAILDNPFEQSQPWMIQGLGMLQLKLDDERKRRLHIWDSRYQILDHTEIHTHPWDFVSTVLNGAICNTVYEQPRYCPLELGPSHFQITIKCGPESCIPSEPVPVWMEKIATLEYHAVNNGSYFMDKSVPHSTTQDPGTITLIERSNHDPENKADIFYPVCGKWVSAEFRKATNEEVIDIINEAKKYL